MPPQPITKGSAAWNLTDYVGDTGKKFSTDEWYELCEARLRLLRPYLETQSLGLLSQVECLWRELHKAKIEDCSVSFEDWHGSAANIQGIFVVGELHHTHPDRKYSDGHVWLCGVERRSATWTLAQVQFVGREGYKSRGEQVARGVILSSSTLPDMCQQAGVQPQLVFEMLGREVQRWNGQATRRFNELQNLSHLVDCQDLVLMARMTKLEEDEEEDSGDDFDLDDPTRVEGYDIDHEGTAEL